MSDEPIKSDFDSFAEFCQREDPVYPQNRHGKFRCPCCVQEHGEAVAGVDQEPRGAGRRGGVAEERLLRARELGVQDEVVLVVHVPELRERPRVAEELPGAAPLDLRSEHETLVHGAPYEWGPYSYALRVGINSAMLFAILSSR